jgi:hypothetical protein
VRWVAVCGRALLCAGLLTHKEANRDDIVSHVKARERLFVRIVYIL